MIGTDAFQETPIVEVTRQITKHNYLVMDIADLPRVMKEVGSETCLFYSTQRLITCPVAWATGLSLAALAPNQCAVRRWDRSVLHCARLVGHLAMAHPPCARKDVGARVDELALHPDVNAWSQAMQTPPM